MFCKPTILIKQMITLGQAESWGGFFSARKSLKKVTEIKSLQLWLPAEAGGRPSAWCRRPNG